jgi:hypothetical protein
MKRITVILTFLLLSVSLIFADSNAQQRRNISGQRRGIGQGQQFSRFYNPETVVSIKGMVENINKYRYGQGGYYGIHVRLNTNEEFYSVHLGPAWFIEKEIKIGQNDLLEITGSKCIYNDTLTVIAAKIKKGDQTLQLRDEIGIPVWSRSGSGRGRQ